jgi:hypothetical protein
LTPGGSSTAHIYTQTVHIISVAYPGIFFGGGGGSTNSVEDRG